jgi:hypothetical protein
MDGGEFGWAMIVGDCVDYRVLVLLGGELTLKVNSARLAVR